MIDKIRKVSPKNPADPDPEGFSGRLFPHLSQGMGQYLCWPAMETFRVLTVWHILDVIQKE